jgi:hypothetical protein
MSMSDDNRIPMPRQTLLDADLPIAYTDPQVETIRIHTITNSDGTSFYRCLGPLAALRKQHRKSIDFQINQLTLNPCDWATMADCDIAFFQRPCLGHHVTAAGIAKMCRTPLILDYDDDLLNLTPDNPCYATYGKDKIRDNIQKLLGMADVVIVSTPAISETFQPFTPNKIVVIRNSWDDSLRPWADPIAIRSNRCIWRGSATHLKDFLEVSHCVHDTADLFSDVKFAFMGWEPFMVTEKLKCEVYPKQEVLDYFDSIRSLAPKIVYVPLHLSQFNRAKSNCGWLEASYAGAAVLAPEGLPEWERPGITLYNGPEHFGDVLQEMLKTPWEELKTRADGSRDYIKANLLLSKVNEQRLAVIRHLLR